MTKSPPPGVPSKRPPRETRTSWPATDRGWTPEKAELARAYVDGPRTVWQSLLADALAEIDRLGRELAGTKRRRRS